jgi:hypothetical protein
MFVYNKHLLINTQVMKKITCTYYTEKATKEHSTFLQYRMCGEIYWV